MNKPTNLIVPLRQGVNYAPLEPLLKLGQKDSKQHYLCDALKERYRHFWNIESTTWREMATAGEMVGHFLAGDQLIERDPFSGGWLIIRPQRQDGASQRAMNMMQYYVTNCLTKWKQSNPNVVAKAAKDDDRAIAAAKAADVIVDHYEAQFYKAWFTLQEALQALTFGTYINRLRYDPGIQGAVGLREVVENRTLQVGEGAGYCGDCEHSAPAADFSQVAAENAEGMPICPKCGSDAVLVEPPATEEVPSIVGVEQVQLGDIILDTLPLLSCRFDLRKRAEWSDWFIYQQQVSIGAIRRILGPVKIPGDESVSLDIGETIMRGLANMGQPISGTSGIPWRMSQRSPEMANLCEMWLSPDQYADIEMKGDERTVDGEPLPAGAKMTDLFPDGMVAVGLNGFAITLGVYAEKHIDHITSGVWHMKPLSGAGRGVTDVVEVQKRFNKLDSQQLAYMDAAGSPAVLFDQSLMGDDEMSYLGNPRANIPVDLSQLPEGRSLAQSVHQMSPSSVPGAMVQYIQQFLTTAFSTTSHVTDFTNGGIAGQRNDTARAAMIADANANSVFGPILAIKGETRQRIAEMLIPMYRQHFPIQRYFSLGGATGQQSGMWLSAADLEGDIRFDVVDESELPQNSVTRQERVVTFFGLFGGFPGYQAALQTNPELVNELGKLWNVSTVSTGFDANAQLCRRRIEQMKQGLQMVQQVAPDMMNAAQDPAVDPMGTGPQIFLEFIQPPVSPLERGHMEKAGWLQTFLDTDEGLELPLPFRGAIELLIQTHFQYAGMQQAAYAAQAGQVQAAGAAFAPSPEGPAEEAAEAA